MSRNFRDTLHCTHILCYTRKDVSFLLLIFYTVSLQKIFEYLKVGDAAQVSSVSPILGGVQKLRRQEEVGGQSNVYKVNDLF